jgi:general secretion pathway protein D
MADPDAKRKVTFNFDAAPLTDVVPVFADLLGFNYYIDPAIKGGISLKMDAELSGREVWDLFEHILWLSGAYADPTPGMINILPLSKMPQSRRIFATHDPVANVEVAIFSVRHGKSAEIAAILKPFMTEGGSVTDFTRLNSLLIVDTPANMGKLRELVTRLDDKGEAGWPFLCLPCHNVDAEDLANELAALLPILGLPVTAEKGPGTTTTGAATPSPAAAAAGPGIKVMPFKRLQVLVVSAPAADLLAEVENWARLLDQSNSAEQESIFFYNVRHSTATHLTEALSAFFNTTTTTSSTQGTSASSASTGSSSTTGSNRTNSLNSTQSSASRTNTARTNAATTTNANANAKTDGSPKTVFDIPVTVYSDSDQNRLTIRTTPRTYAMVEALLKRLDMKPRQVKIQAIVAEITLNKNTEFGFNYAVKNIGSGLASDTSANLNTSASGAALYTAASGTTPASTLSDAFVSSGGALLLKNKAGDKMALIRAIAGETNVRVLSSPEIVAKNDGEAVINVGNRVPILSGYNTNNTTTNNNTNGYSSEVQYVDTGVKLTVTPHITAGNDVNMEIKQEVSDAVKNTASTIDSPVIQSRVLETALVAPDGDTILMGGMIRTKGDDSHSGIPWLKDIPWIGRLFRTNASSSERTELLVLITVNVIDQASEADKLAQRYQAALKEIREKTEQKPAAK